MQECKRYNSAGLMIFANKLLKYRQKKIFADNKQQFSLINNCNGSLKIDISQIDECFYPLIFSSIMMNIKKKFYVISDIEEENVTASILKSIYEKQNVRLIPVIKHDNKFLNKIKSQISNIAVFAPVNKSNNEEPYGMFLEKISNDEFILWGENTLSIPIIVSLSELLNNFKEDVENYSTADDVLEEDLNDLDRINLLAAKEMVRAERITEEDLDSVSLQINKNKEKEEISSQKNEYKIIEEDSEENENPYEETENTEVIKEKVQPEITEEQFEQDTETEQEQAIEKEKNNYQSQEQTNFENSTEEQKTTENSNQSVQQLKEPVQNKVQEKIEEQPLQPKPQKPMPNPETIPVYEPKETEVQPNVTFQEGERVSHAKYGNGVVEKIIKYGKKTLCSIMFEQVGRRLLDPNITIIEKL